MVLFRVVCLFGVAWKGVFDIFGGGGLKSFFVSASDKVLRKQMQILLLGGNSLKSIFMQRNVTQF